MRDFRGYPVYPNPTTSAVYEDIVVPGQPVVLEAGVLYRIEWQPDWPVDYWMSSLCSWPIQWPSPVDTYISYYSGGGKEYFCGGTDHLLLPGDYFDVTFTEQFVLPWTETVEIVVEEPEIVVEEPEPLPEEPAPPEPEPDVPEEPVLEPDTAEEPVVEDPVVSDETEPPATEDLPVTDLPADLPATVTECTPGDISTTLCPDGSTITNWTCDANGFVVYTGAVCPSSPEAEEETKSYLLLGLAAGAVVLIALLAGR